MYWLTSLDTDRLGIPQQAEKSVMRQFPKSKPFRHFIVTSSSYREQAQLKVLVHGRTFRCTTSVLDLLVYSRSSHARS
jgi:hypothetical protein